LIPNTRPIPFYRHDLGQAELDMVKEVLGQPILTTGEYVERAERMLAEYLGVPHCLCVMSCTGALHMSLLALGIGPGDEVITTPMTFIATATAILEAGATPVFVDVEPDSGNLDAARVEAAVTPRTKAILPVHLYGLMCDMRALRAIADRHGLAIIEDAAHCVEGIRDGVRPGGLGDTACFSFYATKNLTCGEGGAVIARDVAVYEKLRLLRVHGMTKIAADRAREGYTHWDMVMMGWKYNMSNIEAALLLPQFARLEAKLVEREALAQRYSERLAKVPGIRVPIQSTGADDVHARHLFPIWVEDGRRDEVVAKLKQRGVEVVVNYRAIHLLSYFREAFGFKPGDFPVAEDIGDGAISLPFFPGMAPQDIDIVANHLHTILEQPSRAAG
jgi:UDP-4-amino-4-deoxy-L-arabinose-oxoglutarate aminotransferase